jgi:GNAT superfamily N-acetyltransferase
MNEAASQINGLVIPSLKEIWKIRQSEQGKGYAGSLLLKLLEYAANKGINEIYCNARIEAVGLYKRFGMVETDHS